MENKLKVLFVASEDSNLIKVGGLGDVAGELPLKLQEKGVDVRVVIPAYEEIKAAKLYLADYPVQMGRRNETCILREAVGTPVKTWLIDNYHFFGRPGVYKHFDDAERFSFFCLAVFEMLNWVDFKPDIIHLNDWHTAPLAMLLRENGHARTQFSDTAILYTVHSMQYQGISGKYVFNLFNLPDAVFTVDKVEYYGGFNAMKAGIHYADAINAVSKTYAREMLTEQSGFGLEGVVWEQQKKLHGIINGIEVANWNPETDSSLFVNYSKNHIDKKAMNKAKLKQELGLEAGDAPLVGAVMRMVPNKGLDILESAMEAIIEEGCQFVLLGNGEKYYEYAFRRLMERYPGKLSVNLEFDPPKARRIYAASDLYAMPSKNEPCGLSQLIAMRYGAIPLVYKTGGLADTVIDEGENPGHGTGFSFSNYSSEAFLATLGKAKKAMACGEEWEALVQRAMERDSSWDEPAAQYIALYQDTMHANRERKTRRRTEL